MLSEEAFQTLYARKDQLEPAEFSALEPYKVDNAIIMAAGKATRFYPISLHTPKGLLKVRGEVLIERQIRQLQEAGIEHIIVVVGYKKEQFAYLADAYGVELLENTEYEQRNNNSTIMCAAPYLGNSFICSSDNYFVENPFEPYVYDSYYAAVYAEGETGEYCLTVDNDDRIIDVHVGGRDAWVMMGHAYWNRDYSASFLRILREGYMEPGAADLLWEDIYRQHLEELPMVMRRYREGLIWEFDALQELLVFDPAFNPSLYADDV